MSKIVIDDAMVDRAGNVLALAGKLYGDWHETVAKALDAALNPPSVNGPLTDDEWRDQEYWRHWIKSDDCRLRGGALGCQIKKFVATIDRLSDTQREERRKAVEAPSGAEEKQACEHSWGESTMYGDVVCCKCAARHGNRRVSAAKPAFDPKRMDDFLPGDDVRRGKLPHL